MSSGAEQFAETAPGVVSASQFFEGKHIHVYSGYLEDVEEEVRFLTLTPSVDDDSVESAFTRVCGQWQNPSTHPNVVTVHDRGRRPRPWLATEMPGGYRLEQLWQHVSAMDIETIVDDVAEAVRNAGLYNTRHLALGPKHVWVDWGEEVTATVDNWGIYRACSVAAGEAPVWPYTAPELVEDPQAGSAETDVYGLGAIAYFALTGRSLFPTADDLTTAILEDPITPPGEIVPQLPRAVDDVVFSALSRDPSERHQSAHEFKEQFRQAMPEEVPALGDGLRTIPPASQASETVTGDDRATPSDS